MRNLKRALSLTLASVMLLGMMVVGSSAAAGYDDVADTDNVEAIEVAQAVGIMIGDENDNFRPGDPVSRAEMAVVMGKLLSLDYNYYEATCPFTDVSGVYDWARGWVGACYANGIVSGRGEGIYDPGATVTAVETASMLMRALGYFKYQSDYANGFEVATVSQATKINLFDGVNSKTNEPLTRNQVAQMVLNALKSGTVEPDGNALNFVDVNGNVIATGGKVNYVFVTSNKAFAQAISSVRATAMGSANDSPIVELGERLFNGDLKLYDPTSDDFERPSRTWEYKGLEVGTYMKVENIKETYTAGVNIRALYDLLGRSSLQEYTVSRYVDGVLADTAENAANTILSRQDKDLAYTGRGVLTQVFVDTTEKTIDITSINTYLAQATTDYNKNNESAMLEVFTVAKEDKVNGIVVSAETKSAVKTVDQADVPEIVDVAKDTYYLVNVTGKYMNASASDLDVKSNTDLSRFEVAVIDNVEIMSDATLTKFSKNSDQDTQSNQNEAFFKSLVTGGTEYKSSARAAYSDEVLDLYAENLLVDKTYNVFLDDYGYAIGVDLYSGNNNYVFITGFDPSGSYITLGTATAAAIFTDGTMSTIKVNVKDTNKNIDKVDEVAGTYFEKWHAQEEQKTSPSETGMFSSKATVNRWYTYTVNSAGEYVLNPATRMITTEVTAKDEVIKCNSVRIDENPARMYDNGWAAYDFDKKAYVNGDTRTYGNDDSIFIVVDIDEKADLSDGRIINDVSGVYTGVQNVEINVKNKEKAATWGANGKTYITTSETGTEKTALYDSIYTLYDKNNYIIASVIIGDAKGGNANCAYILSAAKSEERLSDGTTLWTFDAIVDGKITTLTTSDKFTKVINQLEPGHIQELRYTGDYVTGVKTPENDNSENYYGTAKAFTKGDGGKTTNAGVRITDEGIYDVGHDFNAVSYHDNDCAQTASEHIANITDDGHLATINGKWVAADLRVIGRTMYLNRTESLGALGADYGLTFVQDAPAVVLHKVDGDWKELEFSSVAQAVSELGDADPDVDGKQFAGRVVAPLNDQGVAKWIVFISDTEITTHGAGSVTRNAEIKFNMGDYPVDRYSFYVNGKRVTEDEIVPTGSGLVSFRAPVGASVNLVKLPGTTEFEGKNGDEWVIGSNETVIGYISDEGGTMNFTAVNTTLKSRGNYVPSVRYSLTIDKTITGGTVTSDPAEGSYVSGTQVTLTITPAEGNELKTLTVGGAPVDVTSVKDGKYTFTLTANTTVSATFGTKQTEETKYFTATLEYDNANAKFNVLVDGKPVDLDKVPNDKPITLDPAVALTVKDPGPNTATKNADDTWTVHGDFTVIPNKYAWTDDFFGMAGWIGIKDGSPDLQQPMGAAAAGLALSRFSIARAGSLTPSDCVGIANKDGAFKADIVVNGTTITWIGTKGTGVLPKLTIAEGIDLDNPLVLTAAIESLKYLGKNDPDHVTYTEIEKEPETVDPKSLPVQVTVTTGSGMSKITGIDAYFGNVASGVDANVKKTITPQDIAKALTAKKIPTKAENVDMAKRIAHPDYGEDVTWEASVIPENGVITKGAGNQLWKVAYPGGMVYTKSAENVTLTDKTIQGIIKTSDAWCGKPASTNAGNRLPVTPGSPVSLTAPTNGDVTWAQALEIAKTGFATTSADNKLYVGGTMTATSNSALAYDAYIAGAVGDSLQVLGSSTNSVDYLALGSKITLVPVATNGGTAAKVGQVLTVKVNDKVVATKNVTETGKTEQVEFTIDGAATSTTVADRGKYVNISFELSAVPETEVEVYLNGTRLTDADKTDDGRYILKGVQPGMKIAREKNSGALDSVNTLTNVTFASGTNTALGTAISGQNVTIQKDNPTAWYKVDADDALVQVSTNKGPKQIKLWTVWTVKAAAAIGATSGNWSASTKRNEDGVTLDTTGAIDNSNGNYIKATGSEKIYIRSNDNNTQLWNKAKHTYDGMNAIPGTDAGANLTKTTEKGIWEVTVTDNIDGTNTIDAAYVVGGANTLVAVYGETTTILSSNNLKYGTPVDVDIRTAASVAPASAQDDAIVTAVGHGSEQKEVEMTSNSGVVYTLRLAKTGLELERTDLSTKAEEQPTFSGTFEITLVGGYRTNLNLVVTTAS